MNNQDSIETYIYLLENDKEVNEENIDSFVKYFEQNCISDNSENFCKIFSEVAKSEIGRTKLSNVKIISFLISNLLPHTIKDNSVNVTSVHSCRALGNICFDNDKAREFVSNLNGAEKLLELLKLLLTDVHYTNDNFNSIWGNSGNIFEQKLTLNSCIESDAKENDFDSIKILFNDYKSPLYHIKVVIGCIFNVINDNEMLSEIMVRLGLIETLQILLCQNTFESIIDLVLNIFDFLLDFEFARSKIINIKMLNLISNNIFHESDSIVEHTFQIMSNMDVEKMALIDGGVYTKLVKFVEMRKDRHSDKMLQLAADFIVLLLNGDESMKCLYENGVTEIVFDWIKSENELLHISGAFALSNIARSDETCKELMQKNVLEIIFLVLDQSKPEDIEKHDLQHALISVIRNLAVPGFNKEMLINNKVIDKIFPYIYSSSEAIIFKSLITIRLLVDKQNLNKSNLLNNSDFLKQLLQLAEKSENNSIQCEALRLLSYISVQCTDAKILEHLYDHKVFDHMSDMMMSKHELMSIEALLALDVFIQIIPDILDCKLMIYCKNAQKVLINKLSADGAIFDENNCKLLVKLMESFNKNILHEKLKKYYQEIDIRSSVVALSKLHINENINQLCSIFIQQF